MVARAEHICPERTGLVVAAEEGLHAYICELEPDALAWLDGTAQRNRYRYAWRRDSGSVADNSGGRRQGATVKRIPASAGVLLGVTLGVTWLAKNDEAPECE
jgi:hypothetical protein